MPAFNTNLFNLAQSQYLESHAFQATEQTDRLNNDLNYKFDAANKAYAKFKNMQISQNNMQSLFLKLNRNLNQIVKEDQN